jgi:hypothetical protein
VGTVPGANLSPGSSTVCPCETLQFGTISPWDAAAEPPPFDRGAQIQPWQTLPRSADAGSTLDSKENQGGCPCLYKHKSHAICKNR